jgi:hypothetical protein
MDWPTLIGAFGVGYIIGLVVRPEPSDLEIKCKRLTAQNLCLKADLARMRKERENRP